MLLCHAPGDEFLRLVQDALEVDGIRLASAQVVERLGQATLGDGHALEEIERHRAVVQSDDDGRHACRRSLALTN